MNTKIIALSAVACSIICGCDKIGDASPLCQMQIVGARPNTPEGVRPWIALWITGHDSCLDGAAEDQRISMFETSPATYYRGDATLSVAKPIGKSTVCAVYEWPSWESGVENWSIIVTPPPRTSDDEVPPRAIGLVPSQVEGLKSGSPMPFWLVGDVFKPYLPSPTNTPNCWPGSGV